ncbi:DUF4153 domain-containing protein [Hymenobacter sp. HD11105]
MQLPSLYHLSREAARVVRRFPLTLLCALVLCATFIYLQHLPFDNRSKHDWLFPLISAAVLGLTLTLSVALAAERYRWPLWLRLLTQAGAMALLVLWYVSCPPEPNLRWGMRLFLLLVGQHLLVASVPYLLELRHRADTPGFWRYNETLFLRILTAGLYSGVLFVGCSLALLAVDNLFNVKLDGKLYGYLFTVLATVFNTWFFLAGVPKDFDALERETGYPKGLKLFTQFVLLPLVVLYLAILYAYLARILGLWELPKGWVSTLVLALAVAGIFALLLIHPIRDAAENTWIRTFARWFYWSLFPLLGLLAVAISTRIRAYGITEERYLVLVLAAWLMLISIYFLLRQGRGIVWIPASLAVVAFMSAGGPWGAFSVAERSQLAQLREVSEEYKLLQNGKLDGAGKRVPKLPKEAGKRITSIFDFFAERDNLEAVQPFFTASLTPLDSLRNTKSWQRQRWQSERLFAVSGLERVNYQYSETETEEDQHQSFNFHSNQAAVTQLSSGSYLVRNLTIYSSRGAEIETFTVAEGTFRFRNKEDNSQIHLEQLTKPNTWETMLSVSPATLADSLIRVKQPTNYVNVELPSLSLAASNSTMQLRVLFTHIRRDLQPKQKPTYYFEGDAILTFK